MLQYNKRTSVALDDNAVFRRERERSYRFGWSVN